MLNLNKEHIAEIMVANSEKLSKAKAKEQIDSVLLAIIETLETAKDETPNKKGERAKLTLVGFGTYTLKARKEAIHRNPKTGKEVRKDAHNKVLFKEGKAFTEFIN